MTGFGGARDSALILPAEFSYTLGFVVGYTEMLLQVNTLFIAAPRNTQVLRLFTVGFVFDDLPLPIWLLRPGKTFLLARRRIQTT